MRRAVAGMLAALCIAPALAAGIDPLDDRNAASNAMITLADVGAPLGRLLLVRRGSEVCILRFTAFHRDHNAKDKTAFDSGGESVYAEYDYFYRKPNSSFGTGHRSVARHALAGIGRLAFQSGDDEVRCGHFRLFWAYPTRVGFFSRAESVDTGVELAPTKWAAIQQVIFDDSRIHWYRYEDSRKPTLVPLDALP